MSKKLINKLTNILIILVFLSLSSIGSASQERNEKLKLLEKAQEMSLNFVCFSQSEFEQYLESENFKYLESVCPENKKMWSNSVLIAQSYYFSLLSIVKNFRENSSAKTNSLIKPLNKLLNEILLHRFQLIIKTSEVETEYQRNIRSHIDGNKFLTRYLPTFPDSLENFKANGDKESFETANSYLIQYQYFNYMIRELYQILLSFECIPFSYETEDLLKASVSIHNFLNLESDNAGYPEQGFYRTDGLDSLCDLDYYYLHIHKEECKVQNKSLGAIDFVFLKLSQFEAAKYFGFNIELSESNLISRELPILEYKRKNNIEIEIENSSLSSISDIDLKPEANESKETLNTETRVEENKKEQLQETEIYTPILPSSNKLKDKKILDIVANTKTPADTFLSPLKAKERNWLGNLMEHKLKNVKYRDFRDVWLKLMGRGSIDSQKAGSSHYKLKNKDGQVVGGIFLHGEGQEWQSAYHGVLRDALCKIGIKEEWFK